MATSKPPDAMSVVEVRFRQLLDDGSNEGQLTPEFLAGFTAAQIGRSLVRSKSPAGDSVRNLLDLDKGATLYGAMQKLREMVR
jgi:hypothetical protein